MVVLMFKTKREGGMGWLRRVYPSLVLHYRKGAWWYGSFNLFRRFIIIAVSSAPTSDPEVTATFLAIVVGLVFGFHLMVQPMHYHVNNLGESYVWFISLCLATMNIINFEELEDEQRLLLENVMAVLVYALFFPMPYLLVSFIQGKLPFEFEYLQKDDGLDRFDDLDYFDEFDETGMPINGIHATSIDAMSVDAISVDSPNAEVDDAALEELIRSLPGSPDAKTDDVANSETENKTDGDDEDEDGEEKLFEKFIDLPFKYQLHIKQKPKEEEKKQIEFGKFKKKKKPMEQVKAELGSWLTLPEDLLPPKPKKKEEDEERRSESEEYQSVANMVERQAASLFATDYVIEEVGICFE